MTPDFVSLLMKGQTLVDVRRSDGNLIKVPRWNANGAPSLNAWIRQQVSARLSPLQGEMTAGPDSAVASGTSEPGR